MQVFFKNFLFKNMEWAYNQDIYLMKQPKTGELPSIRRFWVAL